ncbi:hypothetical protein LX64_00626 [Chitinophaga skermanii]|uniref:Uncharacterized protein n=1 Tax=Chitinophaga skermanii TaxID=331697 RepID=A0A327R2E9_9BACT|nr:hypothetical protein LX64_00626 [Chitinophaga skermanii]
MADSHPGTPKNKKARFYNKKRAIIDYYKTNYMLAIFSCCVLPSLLTVMLIG